MYVCMHKAKVQMQVRGKDQVQIQIQYQKPKLQIKNQSRLGLNWVKLNRNFWISVFGYFSQARQIQINLS